MRGLARVAFVTVQVVQGILLGTLLALALLFLVSGGPEAVLFRYSAF